MGPSALRKMHSPREATCLWGVEGSLEGLSKKSKVRVLVFPFSACTLSTVCAVLTFVGQWDISSQELVWEVSRAGSPSHACNDCLRGGRWGREGSEVRGEGDSYFSPDFVLFERVWHVFERSDKNTAPPGDVPTWLSKEPEQREASERQAPGQTGGG